MPVMQLMDKIFRINGPRRTVWYCALVVVVVVVSTIATADCELADKKPRCLLHNIAHCTLLLLVQLLGL